MPSFSQATGLLDELTRFVARPRRSITSRGGRQTVKNPLRNEHPDIYLRPDELVNQSARQGKSPFTVRDEFLAGRNALGQAAPAVPAAAMGAAAMLGGGNEAQAAMAPKNIYEQAVVDQLAQGGAMPTMRAAPEQAGQWAGTLESIETPADMFSPSALAQYLRDIEQNKRSDYMTLLGATGELLDPLTMGITLGHAARGNW